MKAAFLLAAALAATASAQTVVTRCQTEDVKINKYIVRRLVGCGDGFAENTLWHLDRLDSRDGSLDGEFTRPNVKTAAVVYIADTGVEPTHDEFQRAEGTNVVGGIDAANPNGVKVAACGPVGPELHPCLDTNSGASLTIYTHGTAVASLVAGRTVGVAPDARIVSVLNAFVTPAGWLDMLNRIIRHAWDPTTPPFRTAIINISGGVAFTGKASEAATREAITQKIRDMVGGVDAEGRPDAEGKRFLFVAAAGNWAEPMDATGNQGQCDPKGEVRQYPAVLGTSIDGVISVGGTTARNEFWTGSCHGPLIEVVAPADNILAASNTAHDYYRKEDASGTSFSTPIVSGIAAQILGAEPDLSPAELERRIKALSSPLAGGGSSVTLYVPARRRAR